jgi:hypothetical protein
LWFSKEFGLYLGFFVLFSTVLSQWLTVFGRSLWWSIWAFYLPMLTVMYFLRYRPVRGNRSTVAFGAVVLGSVLAKCFVNGYEYITTTLVMMMVPFVYYSILRKSSIGRFARGGLVAATAACLGLLLASVILSIQISAATEGSVGGLEHFLGALRKRTYADPSRYSGALAESMEVAPTDVILGYLSGTYLDLSNDSPSDSSTEGKTEVQVRYYTLIGLYLAASGSVVALNRRWPAAIEPQGSIALVGATWFSILAPLSWFVIFKAHSFLHTHMNFLTWQMPFTIYGFAVCGLAVWWAVMVLIRRPWRESK